jgi:hypothetical protein
MQGRLNPKFIMNPRPRKLAIKLRQLPVPTMYEMNRTGFHTRNPIVV